MELLGLLVDGTASSLAAALLEGDRHTVRSLLAARDAGTWQLILAGYVEGVAHPILLREREEFTLRPYQRQAPDAFVASGSGVVVLPCGAGKTAVAMAAMASISSGRWYSSSTRWPPGSGGPNSSPTPLSVRRRSASTPGSARKFGNSSHHHRHLPDHHQEGWPLAAHGRALGRGLGSHRLRRGPPCCPPRCSA